jgi:hypothetical protein
MPTGLASIQEGQIPPEALQQTCHTLDVGPLTIELCFDPTARTVTVTVTLFGTVILRRVLDATNPTVTVGGSVDSFKAQVTVTLDLGRGVVSISGEFCAPLVGCTDLGPIDVPLLTVAFSPV